MDHGRFTSTLIKKLARYFWRHLMLRPPSLPHLHLVAKTKSKTMLPCIGLVNLDRCCAEQSGNVQWSGNKANTPVIVVYEELNGSCSHNPQFLPEKVQIDQTRQYLPPTVFALIHQLNVYVCQWTFQQLVDKQRR